MAEKQEIKVDTLGIPIRELKEDLDKSLIEEFEDMTKVHKPWAIGLVYFLLMVFYLIFTLKTATLFDFTAFIITSIFVIWTAFLADSFNHFKYISMTIMLILFFVFSYIA